jgi:hypothetical protein
MKPTLKNKGIITVAVLLLLSICENVFCGTEKNISGESSLNAMQVVLYFTILVALIVLPAIKGAQKSHKS